MSSRAMGCCSECCPAGCRKIEHLLQNGAVFERMWQPNISMTVTVNRKNEQKPRSMDGGFFILGGVFSGIQLLPG